MNPDELQAGHQSLLEFLYLYPVGPLQLGKSGVVHMANPLAVQLLMPIARTPMIGNLFELLENCAPEIRNLVDGFEQPRGIVCEDSRIFLGTAGGRNRKKAMEAIVLACTIIKIDDARFMAVIMDTSKQVAHERRLKETKSWVAAILSSVNDFALLSLDSEGRIDSWNQPGVRQTGYQDEDVIGQRLAMFLCPDAPEEPVNWSKSSLHGAMAGIWMKDGGAARAAANTGTRASSRPSKRRMAPSQASPSGSAANPKQG